MIARFTCIVCGDKVIYRRTTGAMRKRCKSCAAAHAARRNQAALVRMTAAHPV